MLLVRTMNDDDLDAVQPLLEQLGYEIEQDEIKRRFLDLAVSKDHALFVAVSDDQVIAFLHVFGRPALEKPAEAVVQSLVVDKIFRKSGVGKRLMATAEGWASDHGFSSVALASQIERDDAHAFYERLGYRQIATSHILRKELGRG